MNPLTRLRILIIFPVVFFISCNSRIPDHKETAELPAIFPDYTDLVIPLNIAPLNFRVMHQGLKYHVLFSSGEEAFTVISRKPEILIPETKWKNLLLKAAGKSINITISVKTREEGWLTFRPLTNSISADRIDACIIYRRINAGMVFWEDMAIVQRSLEDFDENDIISNNNTEHNCLNCHTFLNHDPGTFLIHARAVPGGTIIGRGNEIELVNTKTPFTLSAFVYPAWHPSGKYLACSTNKIHQNFYGRGEMLNHVRDEASDIVLYDIEKNLVFTDPKIAALDFENLPTWSPDGRSLYYICSPYESKNLPDTLEKYDLMKISFNPDTREFVNPEKVLSAEETSRSISFPQVSPDGRFVVCTMADYGYFNINNSSSDIYLIKLSDRSWTRPEINSNKSESFPGWSSNSRWIVFHSKRIDGIYSIPHFAHVDSSGNVSKAFPLPLGHPDEYTGRLTNISRPVFIKGRLNVTKSELQETIYSTAKNVVFDTINVDIDALTRATPQEANPQNSGTPYMRN